MSQPHIGYTHWNNPRENTMPVVQINQPISVADMGVAIEGRANVWPEAGGLQLDFSAFGQQEYFFDVFNRGVQTFNFEAKSSNNWMKLSTTAGKVDKQKRIQVTVDWAQLKEGDHKGYITIKGANLGQTKIAVTAFKAKQETKTGFIEADGYVSIEAANTQVGNNSPHAFWQEIPLHGRTHSSMSVTMPANTSFADNILAAPYLEYDVYLFSSGELRLISLLAPSLNFANGPGLRFGVSIDEQAVFVVDTLEHNSHQDWQQGVIEGVREVTTTLDFKTPGQHSLRIYAIDPGLVLQKIMIDTGGLKSSYLGPPQSTFIAVK
ncbi:hypothetical protein [uncultured Paraglaciecola sp.]|uniref:hypothetical protein n=1 Tax=uncultured Paraglaciecola sp. TaxID=1765024 RepID=UPI0025E172C7|nr:hypothetical protein [uncultured Paraglaciecola sp.]